MDGQEIRQRLQSAGLAPSKDRGQNFLLDETVVDDMIAAARVNSNDLIVEIGPGFGVLTKKLCENAKAVLAMELDHGLAAELCDTVVPQHPNLTLFEGDALSKEAYQAKQAWLKAQGERVSYKVVANLPYQITSKLLRDAMESEPKPQSITVMVQKEVAERATAKPGDMSLLALSIQAYSEARIVRIVPSEAFYPQPEVDSAVLSCDLSRPNASYAGLSPQDRDLFWRVARLGFSSRRKQLKNNLAKPFGRTTAEIAKLFEDIGIKPLARAQELTMAQWVSLSQALAAA